VKREDQNRNSDSGELKEWGTDSNFFRVPDGYFESLPSVISNKINKSDNTLKDNSVNPLIKWAVAAAVILGIIAAGWIYFQKQSMESQRQTATVFTYDELLSSGLIYEYENRLLIEHYFSAAGNNGIQVSDSVRSLNNYLIDHDIDVELIFNEL
jgi:uncharacterized protein HemX